MKKKAFITLLIIISLMLTVFAPIGNAQAAYIVQQLASVSGGLNHTIALRNNGTVMVWGSNQQLQLGLGRSVAERLTPTQIQGFSAVSVAAGHAFSTALTSDGRVHVWGFDKIESPTAVQGISGVAAIAAGQNDVIALREDGTVWQWAADGGTPERVAGLDSVATIAAGGLHFLALKHNGSIWAWGSNSHGQLGIGSTSNQSVPVRVDQIGAAVYISAGFYHSLAITEEGNVFAWGENRHGELGSDASDNSLTPQAVPRLSDVTQVSAGWGSSMALTADGRLYTWGRGELGQLGRGDSPSFVAAPTVVNLPDGSRPVFIDSGVQHNFYLNASGDLSTWGQNNAGQLGTNRKIDLDAPQHSWGNIISALPAYTTDAFNGASAWAKEELSELHSLRMTPLYFWADYATNMSRAELTFMTVRFYEQIRNRNVRINQATTPRFMDIQGHMFEEHILKAYQLDFVSGFSATEFNPNGNLTRQQAAVIISNFVTSILNTEVPETNIRIDMFSDAIDIRPWAAPSVSYVVENGIMQGSNNNFNPNGLLTREQTLLMIYRILVKFDWLP